MYFNYYYLPGRVPGVESQVPHDILDGGNSACLNWKNRKNNILDLNHNFSQYWEDLKREKIGVLQTDLESLYWNKTKEEKVTLLAGEMPLLY